MIDDVAELRVTSGVWTICDCLASPSLLILLTLLALHAITLLFQATAGWKSCTAGRVVQSPLPLLSVSTSHYHEEVCQGCCERKGRGVYIHLLSISGLRTASRDLFFLYLYKRIR